jgi:hypothetical protein
MRKVGVWFLAIAGFVGLLVSVGTIEGHGGGVEWQAGDGKPMVVVKAGDKPMVVVKAGDKPMVVVKPVVYRMGFPDAWVVWEYRPRVPDGCVGEWEITSNGHAAGVYFLRWSFGILVAKSPCAIQLHA